MNMSKLHSSPIALDLAFHSWFVEAVTHMFIQYLDRFSLIEPEQQILLNLNTGELKSDINDLLYIHTQISFRNSTEVNVTTGESIKVHAPCQKNISLDWFPLMTQETLFVHFHRYVKGAAITPNILILIYMLNYVVSI